MAETIPTSTQQSGSSRPEPDNQTPNPQSEPDPPNQTPESAITTDTSSSSANPSSVNPPPLIMPSPPIPSAPSFRPATAPAFSPLPNFENPNMQNQGMSGQMGMSHVSNMVPGGMMPMMSYQVQPGQVPNPSFRPFAPMPNGYPQPPPQGTMPPTGVPRYLPPYMGMVRPAYPPRPGAIGMLPLPSRPPVPGVPGVRPMILPIRPAFVPITPTEKPQTTVYVGKIAPSVENDFMLSVLRLCGPVKSWKRAQDPSDGTPKGFGFCEFESAEGVLRALRLLSKLNVDGQELVLNVNQATREYLVRYVEKKTENAKKSTETKTETETEGAEDKQKTAPGHDESETTKSTEDVEKDGKVSGDKESQDTLVFGSVTDEDREADKEALEKLTSMIEERLKTNPLPPPPPPPAPAQAATDGSRSSTEPPNKSRDGDSDADITKNGTGEDKNDSGTTSRNKLMTKHDRSEAGSPDRTRRYDKNRDKDKDKERNLKHEKEREFDRLEKDAQRERERKERERERKIQEAEREFKESLKEWESREREKERQRQYEKEREKERERKRKKEIKDEETNDDDLSKRVRRSVLEEKRRKRMREREDDVADRLKEEEEIAEAQKRAVEEQQRQQEEDASKVAASHEINSGEKSELAEDTNVETKDKPDEQTSEDTSTDVNYAGDRSLQNGSSDMTNTPPSETLQGSSGPAKKLGFGLVGSGKRTAVASVFNEEHDDDAHNDKKMRPLVPIDYSTEEMQAVQPSSTGQTQPNLAAAAEFAKRISSSNPKEDKPDAEKERSTHTHDRSSHRSRVSNKDDENHREQGPNKLRTPDNKKLLDAKQLIDMIPKTKEELFSYEINWAVYDKHELHERIRPWISKKITEFLGFEEAMLVDFIVTCTQKHVKASEVLESLSDVLDVEAEMFVLKMWRMLIFEIKKVETGISVGPKS